MEFMAVSRLANGAEKRQFFPIWQQHRLSMDASSVVLIGPIGSNP